MTKYRWFCCFVFVLGLIWIVVHNHSLRQRTKAINDILTLLKEDIHQAKMIQRSAETLQFELGLVNQKLSKARERLPYEFNEFLFLADIKTYASDNGVEILEYVRGTSQIHHAVVEHPVAIRARGSYHDFGYFFAQIANDRQMVKIKALHLVSPSDTGKLGVAGWFVTSFFTHREPTRQEALAQLVREKRKQKKNSAP